MARRKGCRQGNGTKKITIGTGADDKEIHREVHEGIRTIREDGRIAYPPGGSSLYDHIHAHGNLRPRLFRFQQSRVCRVVCRAPVQCTYELPLLLALSAYFSEKQLELAGRRASRGLPASLARPWPDRDGTGRAPLRIGV